MTPFRHAWMVCCALIVGVAYSDASDRLSTTEARRFIADYSKVTTQNWPAHLPRKRDIPTGKSGALIRRGVDLLEHTSKTVGPTVDPAHRIAVNNLNCVMCHAVGDSDLPGTRPGQIPFVNVSHDYPKFDPKSMKIISLQDRVRGMFGGGNGKLTDDSDDMKAIIAYFEWLGTFSRPGMRMSGCGLKSIPAPSRRPNPVAGKKIYTAQCAACHGERGEGIKAPDFDRGGGYVFPPIAGGDSFTDGGHLANPVILSRFIWGYMPKGATTTQPKLSVMDVYDVSVYVAALPRRHDPNKVTYCPNPDFPEPTL